MDSSLILSHLNWRYATKRFDPSRKISPLDWSALEESLRLAPSSYGLQLWKFFVVTSHDAREKLRAASWNQAQVTDCSHYLVMTTHRNVTEADIDRFLKSTADARGLHLEKLAGYRKVIVGDLLHGGRSTEIHAWTQRQAYIAMGFLLETAALLAIDTCPMEGLKPEEYDRILGLAGSNMSTVAAVACGYRHPEDRHQKKVRYPRRDVFEDV